MANFLYGCIVSVSLFFGLNNYSYADFFDGNKLYDTCSDEDSGVKVGMCIGYILGVVDLYEGTRNSFKMSKCINANVNGGQLQDIMLKYLKRNPETRHQPGALLIRNALNETFCPSSN